MGCGTCDRDSHADDSAQSPDAELFHAFYHDLLDLIGRHSKGPDGLEIRIRYDPSCDVIRLAGPRATPRDRAADGLADVMELAMSTAEHHPYWGLLYHSSDVADTILQRWDGKGGGKPAAAAAAAGENSEEDEMALGLLSNADAEEIAWALREMKSALDGAAGRRAES